MVVASDDPRVQEMARGITGVVEVTYIERRESFWSVATDVKRILERVDAWLSSLDPSLSKEVLAWGTNVEGGFTGQRVQDALLLIRSYLYLFTAFDVREVHTIADSSSAWEDHVLRACAESRSLPFQRHNSGSLAIWQSVLTRALLPFGIAGYLLFQEVLLGAGRPWRKPQVELTGTVTFQLCSSLRKHVDNVKYLMIALAERGMSPIGLCWSASERVVSPSGAEQLTTSGINAIGLERFVSLRDILASFWVATVIFAKSRQHLFKLNSLRYECVQLTPLLEESITHFITAILPQRLRYARAWGACLSNSTPAAIKPWGAGDFFEGKLALRLLDSGKGSVYIHYWVGAGVPGWPYTDLTHKPDIFLAKSCCEAELAMEEYKLNKSQVEVVGQVRFAHLRRFSIDNPVQVSRRRLKLPLDGVLYVGLDPNALLRGYQTSREQTELLVSTLNAARATSGMVVVIKPHPSYGIDHLMPLIKSYKCKAIIVLSKTAPVEHFLNSIDILITKYTTLILEAALMKRCSIAALFDGEDRFKVFGDLPAVVRSGAELENMLIPLASVSHSFEVWRRDQLSRQERLLPTLYHDQPEDPAALAADAIIKRLKARRLV